MQRRTTTARVALLLVVAALALQATPAIAASAPRSRAGHQLAGSAVRHALERRAATSARISQAIGSAFAPGGAAAPMVVRFLERPATFTRIVTGRPTAALAVAPATIRPRRE